MAKKHSKREARIGVGGGLRPEDEALWHSFSKGIEHGGFKPRVPEADPGVETLRALIDGEQRRPAGRMNGPTNKAGATPGGQPSGAARPAPARVMVKADPGNIDAKAVRRLGNGRLAVDARIDLHGMRQGEAHVALRGFLWRSAAKGHRMVLVITGKGGRRAPTTDFAEAGWLGGEIEPGVLRRQVPMWLRAPEFAALVVGFTTAHIRHGGEGALYVQLRRRA